MHKKIYFILLLLLFGVHQVFSMDAIVDYKHFFDLCQKGNIDAIQKFMTNNPTLNINYKNIYEQTSCLYAATWSGWNVVSHLLKCGADSMAKDCYGHSLFSIAVYAGSHDEPFKRFLTDYSLEDINALCKTMPIERYSDYSEPSIDLFVKKVLHKKKL